MSRQTAVLEILIADSRDSFMRSLRSAMESRLDCRVCGEAANGVEVVEKARQLRPNVIIMNSSMPGFSGRQTTNEIHRELPEATVIMVSSDSADEFESRPGSHSDPARTQTTERDLGQVFVALRIAEAEKRREQGLDKTLEDTFPCSDPLSSIPNPSLQSW